ncbi:hypothetical protein [Roseivirga sp.]|uniref:hypothetical protein n=1 Tax=Roseivirga sp. TaxID=1964215 RepID=UPI003B5193E1
MDVHAEKLLLIEKLLKVKDSGTLEKIKLLLKAEEIHQSAYDKGSPISNDALIKRAEEANRAIEMGNHKSISQLKNDVKSW